MSGHVRIDHEWLQSNLATVGAAGISVLLALLTHANQQGEAWPSLARIERITGLSRHTVIAAIERLEALKIIQRTRRKDAAGDADVNLYLIRLGGSAKNAPPSAIDAPRVVQKLHWGSAKTALEQTPENKHQQNKCGKAAVVDIPKALNTPDFQAAWLEWNQHRKEKRKPLTPTTSKRQLCRLAEWGIGRAIAAINHSIEKGWDGIFEPTTNGHPKNQPACTSASRPMPPPRSSRQPRPSTNGARSDA